MYILPLAWSVVTHKQYINKPLLLFFFYFSSSHSTTPSHPIYIRKFKEMKEILSKGDDLETKTIVETFGNGIRAEEAVPAAIFSFLHKGRVSFDMSINYAISLGGDTDTIASMAGAISGAYWGLDKIPDLWKSKCEGVEEAIEFANKIFELHEKRRETGSNKRVKLQVDED